MHGEEIRMERSYKRRGVTYGEESRMKKVTHKEKLRMEKSYYAWTEVMRGEEIRMERSYG